MDNTLLIHKDCVDGPLAGHLRAANPGHKVVVISKNTEAINPAAGHVSADPRDRFTVKRKFIGLLKRSAKWTADPNGRSTDFAPVQHMEQGCFKFGCSYCYTERHVPNNFLKIYDDLRCAVDLAAQIDRDIPAAEEKFFARNKKPIERVRDPAHNRFVTFELGCDSDLTTSNSVTRHDGYAGHIVEVLNGIAEETQSIMTSFATKSADVDQFIAGCKHPHRHRIRLSVSPEHHRVVLEGNTSKTIDRLHAVNRLVDAGFEVHINLSPIVVTDTFVEEYAALLELIDSVLTPRAKAQLAFEAIFLTHSEKLFLPMAQTMPRAHEMMVEGPLPLVPKPNKPAVLSYSRKNKTSLKAELGYLIEGITPYARVRYAI